jgi:hypothetical protein
VCVVVVVVVVAGCGGWCKSDKGNESAARAVKPDKEAPTKIKRRL